MWKNIMHLLHFVQIKVFDFFYMMWLSIVVAGTTTRNKDKIPPKDKAGISNKLSLD